MTIRARRAAAAIIVLSLGIALFAATGAGASNGGGGTAGGWAPVRHALADANLSALVNAWQAQAYPATAQTVFGADDRIPITDTTLAAYRSVVELGLFDQFDNLEGTCSGSLIGPGVVLTAAHCLYEGGAYVANVLIVPGANGGNFPFGAVDATGVVVAQGWANGVGALSSELVPPSPYDFGLALFDSAAFGTALQPYFTVAPVTDTFLADPSVIIATAGYPGDKPANTMWFTASVDYTWDDTYLYTLMDIAPGQSGSPIFALSVQDYKPYVFSVVSGGNDSYNRSVRFTPTVVGALNQWCAEDGCLISPAPLGDIPVVVPNQPPPPTATATATPSPIATATPSPTTTATSTTTPSPAGHTHAVTIASGLNVVAGPFSSTISPAQFASCLPEDAWLALYVWDPGGQRWLHWFGPTVPAYVNESGATVASSVPRGAGVAILAPPGLAALQVTLPDDLQGACN